MARATVFVGYAVLSEAIDGVYRYAYTEQPYKAILSNQKQIWDRGSQISEKVHIRHSVSIIPNKDNFKLSDIKYVVLHDVKWRVVSIEHQYPRLILNLGEVFND